MPSSSPARILAPWLDADTPVLNTAIVRRALLDVGLCEMPPGSNRSQRIDEYNRAAGADVGSYWCAAALRAWYSEAGAAVPPFAAASCDRWMGWAKERQCWRAEPAPGAAVVYGTPGDASHIGVVVRVSPLVMSVEGNTGLSAYNRNGVAVALKEVTASRVLGYIHPVAA